MYEINELVESLLNSMHPKKMISLAQKPISKKMNDPTIRAITKDIIRFAKRGEHERDT